jgi:hypothetical protein
MFIALAKSAIRFSVMDGLYENISLSYTQLS